MPAKRGKFKWITNGIDEMKIRIEEEIPDGFYQGRAKTSREKISAQVRATIDARTTEEWQEISKKVKAGLAAVDDEKKQLAIESRKKTFKNTLSTCSSEEYERRRNICKQNALKLNEDMRDPAKREAATIKSKATKAAIEKSDPGHYSRIVRRTFENETPEHMAARCKKSGIGVALAFSKKSDAEKTLIRQKAFSTMKLRGTVCSSKAEDRAFTKLCEIYDPTDIERQYSTDTRYPFACDFYVKSKDLFIELNFHWTHNTHPFNKDNADDLEQLHYMEEKAKVSEFYKVAIEVWTKRDVKKLGIAIANKLNYKIFYNENELNNYIMEIKNDGK